jgi:hypothetical protein
LKAAYSWKPIEKVLLATYARAGKVAEIIDVFEKAKKASSKVEIVGSINYFDLPREAIPTQWFNELRRCQSEVFST